MKRKVTGLLKRTQKARQRLVVKSMGCMRCPHARSCRQERPVASKQEDPSRWTSKEGRWKTEA